MAIPEQTLYNTYDPDGVTTVFAYSFCCFSSSDIKVYADDVLVSSSDYTVSGVGSRSGGSVTFTSAPASSIAELRISLVPAFSRSTDYQVNGNLPSETLDNDLDKSYSLLQYINSILGRTLTFSDITATAMSIAGNAAARAGNLLGFDVSGNPALLVPADLSPVTTITAFAETLLDDATSTEARTTLETVKYNRLQDGIRYTTAGTAPTYTITTASPALAAYTTGIRLTAVIHSNGTTGSNTVNVNGLGAKNLKQYDADGNKRSGVLFANQVAIIEYDGTDFVILNPLPIQPLTSVRQAVQGGPVTSSGLPNWAPAAGGGLTFTTVNISSTVPFVVSAAQGYGFGSDRIGSTTSNFSWTLTNNTTNYLYVDVASDGTLSSGVTTVAPAFQNGGTAATTSGLGTFDYYRMVMYYGNGTTAPAVWRVFVGEVVTSGGVTTSITKYAYNGFYFSEGNSFSLGTVSTINHNIGAPCNIKCDIKCATSEYNYSIGDTQPVALSYTGATSQGVVFNTSNYKQGGIVWGSVFWSLDKSSRAGSNLTDSNWRVNYYAKRIF